MKSLCVTLAAGLLVGIGSAMAQTSSAAADSHAQHHSTQPSEAAELSEGEITRLDVPALKVTLRHGELKNLDMPPMTMVFRVKDAAALAPLKAGDKVRFRAERINGAFYLTHIEKAP
jgi:Cu(I)/Ag(I) efflux system periplasmic protein CusF